MNLPDGESRDSFVLFFLARSTGAGAKMNGEIISGCEKSLLEDKNIYSKIIAIMR